MLRIFLIPFKGCVCVVEFCVSVADYVNLFQVCVVGFLTMFCSYRPP